MCVLRTVRAHGQYTVNNT